MSQLELDIRNLEAVDGYRISWRKRRSLAVKKMFSAVIFHFLYYGLRVLERKDERVRGETAEWEDGFTCGIGMGAHGPALYIEKGRRGLQRLSAKKTSPEKMQLMIQFKSVEAAFQVMSAQIGVAESYARHGFILKGDIAKAMSVVRCVDLAEGYLFPGFISKRILKKVPEKRMGLFHTYLEVIKEMMADRRNL